MALKRLAHLVHCTESRIVLKTGQQEKLYPPTDASVSQQCRPQLLSVKFENLVHSIFRNENSTLEINVSHFGVLHWQQWQPPVSAPPLYIFTERGRSFKILFKENYAIALDSCYLFTKNVKNGIEHDIDSAYGDIRLS